MSDFQCDENVLEIYLLSPMIVCVCVCVDVFRSSSVKTFEILLTIKEHYITCTQNFNR